MIRISAVCGIALLALLWLLPWQAILGAAFPAHMIRHMGLVAVAAPLLVIGLPRLAAFAALSPLIGVVVEFAVVWGWHLPALHGLAYRAPAGFVVEQAMFLGAGLLVWAGALRAAQPLAGAGALLLTSMHMTLLGALLVLAPRDLYAEVCGIAPDLGAQQLGGIAMLAIGTPAYLAGGLWLTARALRQPELAQ